MSERRLTRTLMRHPGLARLAVVAALFLMWEIAARFWIDPAFLSPPSRVIASLGDLFGTQGVPAALRITFWELAVAFSISVVIAATLNSIVSSLERRAKRR